MCPRPCLAVLPALFVALAVVTAVAEPFPSVADTVRPMAGRLLGGHAYDGRLSLGWGREAGWEDAFAERGSLLLAWNPGFAGFSSRLAAAASYQGTRFGSSAGLHDRAARFHLGIDEAWLRYTLDAFAWKPGIQAGWFRWRSHDDAALAGEYLVRGNASSGPQAPPEAVWEALDSLTTVVTGVRLSLDSPARRIRPEALFLLDTLFSRPDLSLLGSLEVAPLPGIEAGFAVRLDRLLEPEPLHASQPPRNRTYLPKDTLADTGQVATVDSGTVSYYSIGARSFAARLTVDPVMLFQGKPRRDRGGRFFLETALLGWESVPVFYGDRMQRLHFNAGIHLPAFRLLDVLRLQGELWPEPETRIYGSAIPNLAPAAGDSTGYIASRGAGPSRGWRWQLYLSRALLPWLDVQARVLRERRWGYGDYYFVRPVRAEAGSGPWTAFEVRIAARL